MDNVIIYDKLEELNEGIEYNGGGGGGGGWRGGGGGVVGGGGGGVFLFG